MQLAIFKITTMAGNVVEVEAFTHSQAITVWKDSKPIELFKSCQLVKSSKERDRYYELKALSEPSKADLKEVQNLVDSFQNTDIFKRYKRFTSFKRDPKIGD